MTTAAASSSCSSGARPGRVYNIDGGTELSNRELTAAILEACGAGWDMVVPVTDRKGHDRRYSLDDSAAPVDGLRAARPVRATASRPPSPGTRRTARGGSRSTAPHRRSGPRREAVADHRGGRDARPRPGRACSAAEGEPVTGLNRAALDVTDAAAVAAAVQRHRPDVVVNCAAWTAVDDAEAREDEALAVNGRAVGYLAARLRGRRRRPRPGLHRLRLRRPGASSPTPEDHPAAPRSAYGRTKLAGERAARAALAGRTPTWCGPPGCTARTGPASSGPCSARARAGSPVSVVDDQRGQPTWTADVAAQIHALIAAGARAGTYHATSSGQTTWFGLAREVYALRGGRSGTGHADHQRRLPAPGAAAGLQRARPRRLAGARASSRSATGGTRSSAPSPPCWPPCRAKATTNQDFAERTVVTRGPFGMSAF